MIGTEVRKDPTTEAKYDHYFRHDGESDPV